MTEDATKERQARAAERLLEDEGLTGDLTDDQAKPLLEWASAEAARAAADPAKTEEELDEALRAIRRAVLKAAQEGASEDGERLVARAEEALAPAPPEPPTH